VVQDGERGDRAARKIFASLSMTTGGAVLNGERGDRAARKILRFAQNDDGRRGPEWRAQWPGEARKILRCAQNDRGNGSE
jgi:hypothetical protein